MDGTDTTEERKESGGSELDREFEARLKDAISAIEGDKDSRETKPYSMWQRVFILPVRADGIISRWGRVITGCMFRTERR